jgi:hypothetical protein
MHWEHRSSVVVSLLADVVLVVVHLLSKQLFPQQLVLEGAEKGMKLTVGVWCDAAAVCKNLHAPETSLAESKQV